jgi:dienelactone hydrolase
VRRLVLTSLLGFALAAAAGSSLAVPADGTPARAAARTVFSYDRSAPLAATARFDSETDAGRIHRISFRGARGDRVPGLIIRPKDVAGPGPCVLAGHYLTSNKEEVFAEKADAYAARGVTLLALDARYHGERQAGVGPEAAVARLGTLYNLFRLTVIDMRRGLDYLGRRGLCDPDLVGYEGRSLGGFMGSMLIGADPRVKAAVLLVSGGDWRTYLARSWVALGGNLRGARLNAAVRKLAPIDPVRWIPRARGRAVFMAAGRRDDATPFASAKALHRAAREPKEVLVYDGGHDIEEPHGTRVARAASAFLQRHLQLER